MSYAISIFKTYYPSVCLLLCFPKNLTIFMVLTSICQLLSARCQAGKTRNSFSYYFPSISFPKCSKWTPKSYFKESYEQRYTSTWKPTSWWILGMTQKQLKKQRFCINYFYRWIPCWIFQHPRHTNRSIKTFFFHHFLLPLNIHVWKSLK